MTTTTPSPHEPSHAAGRAGRRRRRRRRAGGEAATAGGARAWTDPDAPTGPVTAALGLLLGGLELVAELCGALGAASD